MPSRQNVFLYYISPPSTYAIYFAVKNEKERKTQSKTEMPSEGRNESCTSPQPVMSDSPGQQHLSTPSRILPEPTGLPAFKVFPDLHFIVGHQYSHSSLLPSLENR